MLKVYEIKRLLNIDMKHNLPLDDIEVIDNITVSRSGYNREVDDDSYFIHGTSLLESKEKIDVSVLLNPDVVSLLEFFPQETKLTIWDKHGKFVDIVNNDDILNVESGLDKKL